MSTKVEEELKKRVERKNAGILCPEMVSGIGKF